ncbi:MAG: type II toxin-antitoxin system PemK/MazF family toxin [Candidatus Kapaibacterium sp.]
MAEYCFGDVVLAEFPFADEFDMKRRPALIVSADPENDLVLLRITSKIRMLDTEVLLRDWEAAGLRLPSVVRVEKIVTSDITFVIKRLGKISHWDAFRVMAGIRKSCERISVEL